MVFPKSLRIRLVAVLACMLLPLVALGASAYYTFDLVEDSFREVVNESLYEMVPLVELRTAVLNYRLALQHLAQEDSEENRRLFATLIMDIGKTFNGMIAFRTAEEQEGMAEALVEWRLAEKATAEILAQPGTFSGPADQEALAGFTVHLDRVVARLDELRGITAAEIEARLARVERTNWWISRLNAGVFLLGIGMVVTLGLLLARSILRPVRQLEAGAGRFAGGDLAHRLQVGRTDELGRLTEAFNIMAEELDRDRRALTELTARDPLTGLYNHREFYRLLREEAERSRRYRHPLSLLMFDLDHFKKVNDTCGHPAGDKVLCGVAGIVRRELRQVDLVARYGGEEFAAILPETAEAEAWAIAERIRQAIAARPLAISDTEGIGLTISIGLAVFPDDAASEEVLVEKADAALYAAKAAGRNRVCRPGARLAAS